MKSFTLLNQSISDFKIDELPGLVKSSISQGKLFRISTVNPEFMLCSKYNLHFSNNLKLAQLRSIDGIGISLSLFLKYRKGFRRNTGVNLTKYLIHNYRLFGLPFVIIGGSQQSQSRFLEKYSVLFPKITFECFGSDINFSKNNNSDIINLINNIKSKYSSAIFFIALGMNKQEYFIEDYIRPNFSGIAIGVGGTIDYLSDLIKQPSIFIKSLGLEWLHRLFTQPRARIFRIIKAAVIYPFIFFIYDLIPFYLRQNKKPDN